MLHWRWGMVGVALSLMGLTIAGAGGGDGPPAAEAKDEYATAVRPLLKQYCLVCHSTKVKKGGLDLERFASLDQVRKDVKPWQALIEMLESGEMPPKSKPQPTAEERKRLLGWVRGFVDVEARARAGDPGPAPLRRLSNAEYTGTIRDLTDVDLQPAREFPADGAAGEGFTNAAEALSLSPALLDKYLGAAKDVADHAVLLPDGFRFSPAKTRRDWTNECLARLRAFYADYTSRRPLAAGAVPDGHRPPSRRVARRQDHAGCRGGQRKAQPEVPRNPVADLDRRAPSYPLDRIRARWRRASEKDVPALRRGDLRLAGGAVEVRPHRQLQRRQHGSAGGERSRAGRVANPETESEAGARARRSRALPGDRRAAPAAQGGYVVWHRPRLEGVNKPALLLRDYAQFGPQYEVDYAAVFADSAKYLAAAVEAAKDRKLSADDVAKKHGLDAALTKRWIDVLAVSGRAPGAEDPGREVPAVALELLGEKSPKNDQKPAINGWKKKGADLPVLVTNASDKVEHVPGRVSPHRVTVHPTPTEFVAAVWKSPLDGTVRVAAKIAHAHPACGNGVAWWLEHRRGRPGRRPCRGRDRRRRGGAGRASEPEGRQGGPGLPGRRRA